MMTKNIWDNWQFVWRIVFGILLSASVLLTLGDDTHLLDVTSFGILVVLFMVWYGLGESGFVQARFASIFIGFGYFFVGWLLWYALVAMSSTFFLMLFALFPHIFTQLPLRWGIVLGALLNIIVLLATDRIDSTLTSTWMLILVGTSLSGSLLAYFIDRIIKQSEERQRLIDDLETAREAIAQAKYEAGVLHERERLASELHDTIVQGLIAIVTQLEAYDNSHDADKQKSHIERTKAIARQNLQEARRFIWETQSSHIVPEQFVEQLQRMAGAWSEEEAISYRIYVSGRSEAKLPSAITHALLRVVQEALLNISKHAKAQHVTITLTWVADAILLDICDDGMGFAIEKAHQVGYGLVSMRRRVEALGGVFTIESDLGEGTTIALEIPVLTSDTAANDDEA